MLLIVGGTGTLGTPLVRALAGRGEAVRVLTRNPARARHLEPLGVEMVVGDARDQAAVERAVAGVGTVVSAMHGLAGPSGESPQTVDAEGNAHLIAAAERQGVDRFVLLSLAGATEDHPLELARAKATAERRLRSSSLAWTIVRPTAFMETWARLVGEPMLRTGATRLFGRGENPINFVSAHDVARLLERVVLDPSPGETVVDVGGPENLTFRQFVKVFADAAGIAKPRVQTVPRPALRLVAGALRPFRPDVARLVRASLVMDTCDLRFDPTSFRTRFPELPLTSLAGVVERDYAPLLAGRRPAVAGTVGAALDPGAP